MVIHELKLDLIPKGIPPHIHVKQYDNETRIVRVSLYDSGNEYSPAVSDIIMLQGSKPDGNIFAIEREAGTLDFILTQQSTAVPGKTRCEIKITDSSGAIRTIDFIMYVQEAAVPAGVEIDESTIEAYEALTQRVEQAAAGISEDVTAAETAATNAANSASDAASSAAEAESAAQTAAQSVLSQVAGLIYPVGSVYISKTNTSPATLFGIGTWTPIKDKFILAAGDTYTAGDTGGSEDHTHEYKLRIAAQWGVATNEDTYIGNVYDYTADKWANGTRLLPDGGASRYKNATQANREAGSTSFWQSVGDVETVSNMPPYEVFYMWERTA